MSIRSASKALILHRGKLLLNECRDADGAVYYALPGGGQHRFETMEEAVVRECLEETGYSVRPLRFAAICEVIHQDKINSADPVALAYAHRINHVFLCSLENDQAQTPLERDDRQLGCRWVDSGEAETLPLYPLAVREHLRELLDGNAPLYLGSQREG